MNWRKLVTGFLFLIVIIFAAIAATGLTLVIMDFIYDVQFAVTPTPIG